MRSCQFCGGPVEFTEPVAEESAPLAPPVSNVAAQTPFESAAPEPIASASLPAAPSPPASNGGDAQPGSVKERKAPASKTRGLSCAVPAAIGLFAVLLLIFMGYRLLSSFTGSGFSPIGNGAHPSSASQSSGSAAAADLGVDLYPGARPLSDPDRRDSSGSTVVSQSFVTDARMDLVIDFYKARMVGQTSIYASGNGVVVSISPSPQETVQVAIAPAPSAPGTRIAITHTTTGN